jgi:hypothetical protein
MKIIILLALLSSTVWAQNPLVGKELPNLILKDDDGGRLDGSEWSLEQSINENKVTVIFYADPDEKDKNEEISERFLKKKYPLDKVQFLGMINMEATWLPNFAISEALKSKQRKYPDTLYLKDYTKKAVKVWKIADDENNVIALDQKGKVIFAKFGYVTKEEGDKLIALIDNLIK